MTTQEITQEVKRLFLKDVITKEDVIQANKLISRYKALKPNWKDENTEENSKRTQRSNTRQAPYKLVGIYQSRSSR